MRIDLSSFDAVPLPERPSGQVQSSEGPDFSSLLKSFVAPSPPTEVKPPPDLQLYADLRTQKLEQREQRADLEETRHQSYLAGLETSQDHMEDLVEDWKERSPYDPDEEVSAESEAGEAEEDISAILDGSDDVGELISDFDELPLETNEQNQSSSSGEEGGRQGSGQQSSSFASDSGHSNERELNYQEIQALMETTLNNRKNLPPRVRKVLKELLEALLDGQRWLLDQHRLIGLEQGEWDLVLQLFPAHFYSGLLRQHRHGELPLYPLLQELFEQTPPTPERQQQLLALWQPAFGPDIDHLPLLLRNWVLDQPLLGPEQELENLLELWQHHQALPPGATGRTLQLALAYRHHPEKMQQLFRLSKCLLHGQALDDAQIGLLAQCLAERCYPRELSDLDQMQKLLQLVLRGHEPEENDLMQLLAGCNQGVLSYLPYALLHPSLQDLQDYVRRDLLGREELVPALLLDEDSSLTM